MTLETSIWVEMTLRIWCSFANLLIFLVYRQHQPRPARSEPMMPWTWSMQPLAWDSKLQRCWDAQRMVQTCKHVKMFLSFAGCIIAYQCMWFYDYNCEILWYIMDTLDTLSDTPQHVHELCRIRSGSKVFSADKAQRSRGPWTTSGVGALSRYGWMGREPSHSPVTESWRPWLAEAASLTGTSRFMFRPYSEICSFWRHFSISCAHQEHCSISKFRRWVSRRRLEFLGRYSTHFSVEHVLLFWRRWAYFRKMVTWREPCRCRFSSGSLQGRYLPDDWKPPEMRKRRFRATTCFRHSRF